MIRTWVRPKVAKALLVLFVVALVAGMLAGRQAAADEYGPRPTPAFEPEWEPGPGWPEGWKEPAPPTELSEGIKENFDYLRSMPNLKTKPERLALHVETKLPGWTREYPYLWTSIEIMCGTTMWEYAFPQPDSSLLRQMTGHSYSYVGGTGGGDDCGVHPLTDIKQNENPPDDWEEQAYLRNHVGESVWKARGDLRECNASYREGSPDRIEVCFNDGRASERFDAPAYLDLEVGRVRVPVRFVSEMMGAEVSWDQETWSATLKFPARSWDVITPEMLPGFTWDQYWDEGGYGATETGKFKWVLKTVSQPAKTIVLTVGKKTALVDGQEVVIDAPPVIQPPGRLMVPVRFISETMGAKVYWVGQEPIWPMPNGVDMGGRYQVHIFTPFWPWYENPSWFLENRAMRF